MLSLWNLAILLRLYSDQNKYKSDVAYQEINRHLFFKIVIYFCLRNYPSRLGSWPTSLVCPGLWEVPWRRQWHPTLVLLPGKSHGQRCLVGCSPWGREELDTTEWLHFHFSLSCIGEGSGNPLQCSGLENPRDGGAWWAAIYGLAQSQTWLKWLSSNSGRFLRAWDFKY